MKQYVIDSSVLVKWFIPELHKKHALLLRDPTFELYAPDLMKLEVANVLIKKVRRKELDITEALLIKSDLKQLPIKLYGWKLLIDDAWLIAHETYCALYDCLYVALAVKLDIQFITADQRLYTGLQNTPYKDFIYWIEELV